MPEAEEERWLTYAEAGQLLGISPAAARMHAKRRGWRRRSPNAIGAHAMILVPADVAVQPRAPAVQRTFVEHMGAEPNGADQANVQAISSAIAALLEQLTIANERAARAEHLFEDERKRVDELRTALADAVAAERIAAGTAAGLRAEIAILTDQRARPWWRRWFR